jgi:hypothetical protein
LETAVEVAEFQRKMSYEMAPDTALKVYTGVTLIPFPDGLICTGAIGSVFTFSVTTADPPTLPAAL